MSTRLEAAWQDVIGAIDKGNITALVNVLNKSGALDSVLAEAAAELHADRAPRPSGGQLATALALIEAGAAKDAVLAKVSRRTYYRARRECQECQVTPASTDNLLTQ